MHADGSRCSFRGRLFCEPAIPNLWPFAKRVSLCEPQRFPPKKPKHGHNALIWYLLHVESFTWFVKNGTANFGRIGTMESDPEYSGRKKPKLNSERICSCRKCYHRLPELRFLVDRLSRYLFVDVGHAIFVNHTRPPELKFEASTPSESAVAPKSLQSRT